MAQSAGAGQELGCGVAPAAQNGRGMAKIGIIGAGAFGTALSAVMRRAGHDVTIWAREREVAAAINERIMNAIFLPGIALPPGIRATVDLAVVAKDMDVLLLAP